MSFQPVLLWSDAFMWGLVLTASFFFIRSVKSVQWSRYWYMIGCSRAGMASATLLACFVFIGLADSLHFRPRLVSVESVASEEYSIEVLSVLDVWLTSLRTQHEHTYSAPLATHGFSKESVASLSATEKKSRDYPRLVFGGRHLSDPAQKWADIKARVWSGVGKMLVIFSLMVAVATALVAIQKKTSLARSLRAVLSGETSFAWNAVLWMLLVVGGLGFALAELVDGYHVFGTDKVGQDVLYLILKSIRTALVIGLLTTLVTLPIAILLGITAGYFRGWVDDLIQYIYTTLSSIPGVLLIAASVLMMQMVIDNHPDWFTTAVERGDVRLLALCVILGLTSWSGLCRLLRGETLKLRELDYVLAARAFGVSPARIILRHILPNLMHIVIIALVMDFSGLVLSEAVLSYVGIGVDPTMISFGSMINNARMELAREPCVWWSLAAAFAFMFAMVLSANLLADVVRDVFDPKHKVR